MSVSHGRLQFFALEASDYLERLSLILSRPVPPDGDELVRLARALRGAALMAGPAPMAEAAGALERMTKAYRDSRLSWTMPRADLLGDAIEEFKRLTRQVVEWSEADTRAARRLGAGLAALLATEGLEPAETAPPGASDDLQPSVRAFIAREAALIAGTLEHAAQALELGQPAQASEVVLQRLQPLRGLGSLPTLSPMPELLDAIELVVSGLRDGLAPPPAGEHALRTSAAALTRLARDVAERGRPAPGAGEPARAVADLLATFGREDDIVSIETLFAPGDPEAIVRRGEPPAARAGSADAGIELVSLADRLRQASEQVTVAESDAGRALQIFALLLELRRLVARGALGAVRLLLSAVMDAIASGRAQGDPSRFAALLRGSAEGLAAAAETGAGGPARADLEGTLRELAELGRGRAASRGAEEAAVAADGADEAEPAIVPIETLLAQPTATEMTPFARSFSTWFRLEQETVEPAVVPIGHLLYRGRRALERADVLRRELEVILKTTRDFDLAEPLLGELLDLVPLALAD